MKRIITFLLVVILVFPSLAFADCGMGPGPGVKRYAGGAATCTQVTSLDDVDAYQPVASGAGNEYVAIQFTAGNWGPISKIQLYIDRGLGATLTGQTWTIQLYENNSGDPGSKIANGSCTIANPNTVVPALNSPTWVGCTLSTPVQLTNSTSYHVGLNRGGLTDGTNFIRMWHYTGGAGADDMNKDADESGSWTALDFNTQATLRLFTGAACTAP